MTVETQALNEEVLESPTETEETLIDTEESSTEKTTEKPEDVEEEAPHETTVPYDRFKEVNETNKSLAARIAELEAMAGGLEPEPESEPDENALDEDQYLSYLEAAIANGDFASEFEEKQAKFARTEILQRRHDRAQSAEQAALKEFDATLQAIRDTGEAISDTDRELILQQAAMFNAPVADATEAAFHLLRSRGKLSGKASTPTQPQPTNPLSQIAAGKRRIAQTPGPVVGDKKPEVATSLGGQIEDSIKRHEAALREAGYIT